MNVLAWIFVAIWVLGNLFMFLNACGEYIKGNTREAVSTIFGQIFGLGIVWAFIHLGSQGLLGI